MCKRVSRGLKCLEIVELLEGNSMRNPSISMRSCCAALQSCSLSAARLQKAAGTILDRQLQHLYSLR